MRKTNFWNRDLLKPILNRISKKLNSYSDWFNNIWSTIFVSGTSTDTNNRITKSRGSQATVDLTFPTTVNYDFAMDLYYNRRAGYKLGAFFCYSIIAIPLTFMGFPHFDVEDWSKVGNEEFWMKRFEFYNKNMMMDKQGIQKLTHITGTLGVFPWFSAKDGYVNLYFIKNKYITDIYVNPDTQKLTGLKTDINYMFTWDDGQEYRFTEIKIYTKSRIKTIRKGTFPPKIRGTEIRRNPTKRLPVIFTNDREPGEFEGHSEFERITPLIKAYAEINQRAHEEAANIKAKLIQQVNNKKDWLAANGYDDINDISIENNDFVLNVEGEDTRIEVPQNLIDNHIKLMELDYWNISQTSRIPEIFWGLEASGNLASAGKQDKYGLAFVGAKQQQATPPYNELLESIVLLDGMAYNQTPPSGLVNTWDDFDSLTEVERAEIFDKWCTGIQKLMDSNAIDLQGAHQILLGLTKNKITDDYDEFKKQVTEHGTLRAFLEQDYGSMMDFQESDDSGNGNGNGDNEELIKEIEKAIRNRRLIIK